MTYDELCDRMRRDYITRELHRQFIDDAIANMADDELAVIQEMAAMDLNDELWAAKHVRDSDPRTNKVVRAKVFELLPPPTQEQKQAALRAIDQRLMNQCGMVTKKAPQSDLRRDSGGSPPNTSEWNHPHPGAQSQSEGGQP